MGYNSAFVVLHDQLDGIAKVKTLGETLEAALVGDDKISLRELEAMGIKVITRDHSSYLVPIFMGGNTGKRIAGILIDVKDENPEVTLLKQLAAKHGFSIKKK